MFYTWACPRRPIGTSLGLDWDENSYLGNPTLKWTYQQKRLFRKPTNPPPSVKTGLIHLRKIWEKKYRTNSNGKRKHRNYNNASRKTINSNRKNQQHSFIRPTTTGGHSTVSQQSRATLPPSRTRRHSGHLHFLELFHFMLLYSQ